MNNPPHITGQLRYGITSGPSRIDGKGAFSTGEIPAHKKLGNMDGEIISLRTARRRAAHTQRVAIVEFGDGRALDAGSVETPLKYINHSCCPNTYMRVAYSRVEFYSLRRIGKGEELTCNYGPTHHDGRLPCRCGSPGCKGFI